MKSGCSKKYVHVHMYILHTGCPGKLVTLVTVIHEMTRLLVLISIATTYNHACATIPLGIKIYNVSL